MPLRFLEYVSRLYEKIIPLEKRYEHKAVGLPLSEFYVFYNGTQDYPAETELRLSSSFKLADGAKKDFQLELRAKVYNINRRDEIPFLRSCAPLDGYAVLGLYADEARKAGRENFIDYAVQRCIQEGILTDYLKRNSTEVRNMLIGEYDYDTDIKVQRQESYNEGISQGAARQKAEDEKILATERDQNKRLNERIAELEAMLAKR